jgi:lysophospholipase L1-like esterase
MMKKAGITLFFVFVLLQCYAKQGRLQTFLPDHPFIQYTGRIDFSHPQLPRFWQPGVYISFRFRGNACEVLLNDEMLWGSNHNYIELIVDGKAVRLQTKTKHDTLSITTYLSKAKEHSVIICKNTEANIGYLELAGIRCYELLKPFQKPQRKIECIGNSITCGAGSDAGSIPCGKGKWHDQHNAWLSYGAVTARNLNAQFHLSSVSGIGLMHSCCNMNITMPQVFDKVSMRNDSIQWNFAGYQPDVVTVCLGQNDGIQDSAQFCINYISFIKQLRGYYPKAQIILLSSPMADAGLKAFMKKTLTEVMKKLHTEGDKKVATFFFSKQYNSGCDYHPDLAEHKQIATELTAAVKKIMKW